MNDIIETRMEKKSPKQTPLKTRDKQNVNISSNANVVQDVIVSSVRTTRSIYLQC